MKSYEEQIHIGLWSSISMDETIILKVGIDFTVQLATEYRKLLDKQIKPLLELADSILADLPIITGRKICPCCRKTFSTPNRTFCGNACVRHPACNKPSQTWEEENY